MYSLYIADDSLENTTNIRLNTVKNKDCSNKMKLNYASFETNNRIKKVFDKSLSKKKYSVFVPQKKVEVENLQKVDVLKRYLSSQSVK
jgi:hypothetical protein